MERDMLTVSSHLLISESVHFEGSSNISFVIVTAGKRERGLDQKERKMWKGRITSCRILFSRKNITTPNTPCCCCGYDSCEAFMIERRVSVQGRVHKDWLGLYLGLHSLYTISSIIF